MRTQCGTIIMAMIALAVGAAAGWFAAGFVKGRQHAGGVGVSPAQCDGQGVHRASKAPSPRRKAPIRSSADAEVQKRILKANIAALEKSLAAAKKEAAAIAEAKATKDSTGNLGENAQKSQSRASMIALGKKGQNITIGEWRRYAPERWEEIRNMQERWNDSKRRQVIDMCEMLASADTSAMNEEERSLHLKYMQTLTDYQAAVDRDLYEISDEAPLKDMLYSSEVQRLCDSLAGRAKGSDVSSSAERNMLLGMAAKQLGLSEDAMKDFYGVSEKAFEAVFDFCTFNSSGDGKGELKGGVQ